MTFSGRHEISCAARTGIKYSAYCSGLVSSVWYVHVSVCADNIFRLVHTDMHWSVCVLRQYQIDAWRSTERNPFTVFM